MSARKRFSKAAMIDRLKNSMAALSGTAIGVGLKKGFDLGDGYSQVIGRGEELNRLYGEWDYCRRLLGELENG